MMTVTLDICLCTFQRPIVADTLASLEAAERPKGLSVRVIVIDNDAVPSGQAVVETAGQRMPLPVVYAHVPGGNIAIARNAALDRADADWIAFLDDDERVDPFWFIQICKSLTSGQADAIFGPAVANYPPSAPAWMKQAQPHAQPVPVRGGQIHTGHTCNAALRWADTAWQAVRFDTNFGQSGGEDTMFFAAIKAAGARFGATDATVYEDVPEARLRFRWLARRRFRIGQTNGVSDILTGGRGRRTLSASAKVLACAAMTILTGLTPARRNMWALRLVMHAGVVAACLGMRPAQLYGHTPPPNA